MNPLPSAEASLLLVGIAGGAALVAPLLAGALIAAWRARKRLADASEAHRSEGDRALEAAGRLASVEAALDALPDWVLRVKSDGEIVATNSPTSKAFHVQATELVGTSVYECFPRKAAPFLRTQIGRAAERGRAAGLGFMFDGGRAYGEARIFPIDGELLVVVRDTTDQKAKEDTLHKSKERFALAVQGANDGLWDWNLTTERVYYSYTWRTMTGVDEGEESLSSWLERVHPEDLGALRRALDEHVAGATSRFENEHRIRQRDGSWLWVLARGMAVRAADGSALRMAGSLTDLTNRRVVAVTNEKANLLDHATTAVGIGVGVLLPGGALTRANGTLLDMTRAWDALETWWEAVTARAPSAPTQRCPACRHRAHSGTVLAELDDPGGRPRVFELAWAGHAHELGMQGAHVVLVKDVTEATLAKRRLQRVHEELVVARDQALAASRAKSQFLANMSHELRTPLNHIIGYAEMLLEEAEDSSWPIGEDLQRIHTSARHLLQLIAGVLDLSRIEAGARSMNPMSFAVAAVVQEVADDMREAVVHNGNAFDVVVDAELDTMIADRDHLRRILTTLLSNAAKFTHGGRVELGVGPHEREGARWTEFRVLDTGQGMTTEQVARLSEQFYMADDSTTRDKGGMGLGLALAWRFVDMMGGQLEVKSELGEGSTFTVLLPRDATPAPEGTRAVH